MKSCFLGLFPSPHLSSRGDDITPVNMYVCVAMMYFHCRAQVRLKKSLNLKEEKKTKQSIKNVK